MLIRVLVNKANNIFRLKIEVIFSGIKNIENNNLKCICSTFAGYKLFVYPYITLIVHINIAYCQFLLSQDFQPWFVGSHRT